MDVGVQENLNYIPGTNLITKHDGRRFVMPSRAFSEFKDRKFREVRRIANAFEYLNDRPGPNTTHSVLHGGLVLLVSYWEVYCEDACKQAAEVIGRKSNLKFQTVMFAAGNTPPHVTD